MNTTTGSIHPGIKALVAGCSLALLSAFVWYSHSQAQSKPTTAAETSTKSPEMTAVTPSADTAKQAVTPPNTTQPATQSQLDILMLSSKSYTGTTVIKPEALHTPKDITPNGNTKLFRSQEPKPKAIHAAEDTSKPNIPKDILMPGSKLGLIITTIKDPGSKGDNNQPQPQLNGTIAFPIQSTGTSPQPVAPNDVLMLSSKALSQPVFSERKVSPDSQKAAPPTAPEKSDQKGATDAPIKKAAP